MSGELSQDEAFARARAVVERLQLAYKRVFGGGATKEDRMLVVADLENVTGARRNQLRETGHATIYEMGKFAVWQRINNMRFPRPADARAEFRVSVQRSGGLSNEQDQSQGQGEGQGEEHRRTEAGRGVAEVTED